MERLIIKETEDTPSIIFDNITGIFEIKGKSIPENAVTFYKPVINWLGEYLTFPHENTTVNIQLDYFNTSSLMYIYTVLRAIEAIHKAGHKIIINWFYEKGSEGIFEAGEEYKASVSLTFNLIEFE